jgi:NADH dehydrogenase
MTGPVRIVIVGGGYVGMYTALSLQRKLPRHRAEVTVQPAEGEPFQLEYDLIVVCPGSISRLLPIPGLAEQGVGFKTIGEAIYLRNHVLARLDLASTITDTARRKKALTFVFVGGGYAGVEAMAELEDMARYATRYYDMLKPSDMRWVLVEAADRIMPEVSVNLGSYTADRLAERGIDVRLSTRLESVVGGHVVLSDGDEFDAETLVWTAGVKANPLLGHPGLVRAPDLPCLADADLQPQGAGADRLDRCAVLSPRGRLARTAADAAHRVRAGRRHPRVATGVLSRCVSRGPSLGCGSCAPVAQWQRQTP